MSMFFYTGVKSGRLSQKKKKKIVKKLPAKRAHVKYAPRTCYDLGVPLSTTRRILVRRPL